MAAISAFSFSGVLQKPWPPCFECTVVPFKRTSKFPVLPSSLFRGRGGLADLLKGIEASVR